MRKIYRCFPKIPLSGTMTSPDCPKTLRSSPCVSALPIFKTPSRSSYAFLELKAGIIVLVSGIAKYSHVCYMVAQLQPERAEGHNRLRSSFPSAWPYLLYQRLFMFFSRKEEYFLLCLLKGSKTTLMTCFGCPKRRGGSGNVLPLFF